MAASLQQLLVTNFGLSPSGYTGSQGAAGYTGSAGAGAAVPTISAIAYPGDDTAADPAGGQTITLTGTGFAAGATVIVNGNVVPVLSVVNSTTITFTTPAASAGSYIIYVVNTNGTTALAVPGLQYSGTPAWTTSAGSLGTPSQNTSFSANLVATGDAPITYSVYSGSLPSGVSLNGNTGVISGTTPTVASNTTYNFTIRATDAQLQDTDRAFSLTVNAINTTPTVEYLVVAGGGGGGWMLAGGGGAGGFRTATGFSVTAGSPITVTVGAGGAGNAGSSNTYNGSTGYCGSPGSDSVFSSITSSGGGGGGSYNSTSLNGVAGGSGGGAGADATSSWSGGAGNTPSTSPSQGNNGGGTIPNGKYGSGGGGGAGAVGGTGSSASGAGGDGLQSDILGTGSIYYAGGGGGGTYVAFGGTRGPGGQGGGGNGGTDNFGYAGTVNTGGGGGGSGWSGGTGGGIGGSGIVVIRYADTYAAATSTTGSPTITNPTGYRVYKWTSSGSITF